MAGMVRVDVVSAASSLCLWVVGMCGLSVCGVGVATAQDDSALTWVDPELPEAVIAADLIVVGEVVAVSPQGATIEIQRTLKGPPRDGQRVAVGNLHHPELSAGPPVGEGDVAYFVLLGAANGEAFTTPTPTFGRFPVRSFGPVQQVIAPLPDSFTRLAMEPDEFEKLVEGILRGYSGELLTWAQETLGPEAEPSVQEAYLALCYLSLFGRQLDLPLVLRLLEDDRMHHEEHYKVRIMAARAMGHMGGIEALDALAGMVEEDAVYGVQSAAATALGEVLPAYRRQPLFDRVVGRLVVVATDDECLASPLREASSPRDTRSNETPSPLGAILGTLARVRASEGVGAALAAMDREDDLDALLAGLAFFTAYGDPRVAGYLTWRMGTRGSDREAYNRLIGRTLQGLTHESLGEDRAAWAAYCEAQGWTVGPRPTEDE